MIWSSTRSRSSSASPKASGLHRPPRPSPSGPGRDPARATAGPEALVHRAHPIRQQSTTSPPPCWHRFWPRSGPARRSPTSTYRMTVDLPRRHRAPPGRPGIAHEPAPTPRPTGCRHASTPAWWSTSPPSVGSSRNSARWSTGTGCSPRSRPTSSSCTRTGLLVYGNRAAARLSGAARSEEDYRQTVARALRPTHDRLHAPRRHPRPGGASGPAHRARSVLRARRGPLGGPERRGDLHGGHQHPHHLGWRARLPGDHAGTSPSDAPPRPPTATGPAWWPTSPTPSSVSTPRA